VIVSVDNLKAIAAALGISVEYSWSGVDTLRRIVDYYGGDGFIYNEGQVQLLRRWLLAIGGDPECCLIESEGDILGKILEQYGGGLGSGRSIPWKLDAILAAIEATPAFDPDAADFFIATGITDPVQKDAVNTLVVSLKSESLWTKIVALYPFIGGTANAHSYNLRDRSAYQITWSGTVTHDANGITGDGLTGYGDTGLLGSSLTSTDSHLALYSRTLLAAALPDAGASTDDDATIFDLWCFTVGGDRVISRSFNGTFLINAGASAGGLITTTRSGTTHTNYRNGSALGSNSNSANASTGVPSIYVLSYNKSDTPQTFATTNLAMMSIGRSFSAGDVTAFNSLVQAFQTALGRNV
jgi:hypothetical protein